MADQGPPESGGRQPIPPAKRRRLQQMFDHGNRSTAKGDFAYATEMYTQCVVGDPGNFVYVSNFLGNLKKQYNNNKKGSKLAGVKGMTIKGSIKKAQMQSDLDSLFAAGAEMLKLNPWDHGALTALAAACEQLEYDECQLAYIKQLLDVDIKDAEVNQLAGRALGRMGKFDEAIMCWHRVEQAKPNDEEAKRAIGNLVVEKTISKGGYEDAESTTDVMSDKQGQADRQGAGAAKLTPVQQLEKQIAKDPANVSLYLQLAEIHNRYEDFAKAEEVLTKALAVSGGEINVRERLEDTQLRRQKIQVEIARRKAGEDKSSASLELYKSLKAEYAHLDLQVCQSRVERYPTNLQYKYELAVRLQAAKKYNEAIKAYQEARNDPARKGAVYLALGECFQQIEQYKLAMSNYEQAVGEISEKDEDAKKLALYRAGVLAMGMKEIDKADKYLTELAGREFGYKDVAERLDKLKDIRDKG